MEGADDGVYNRTVPLGKLQTIGQLPRVSLLIFHGSGVEAASLGQGQAVVIGRAPPADVAVPDASLSRGHARFEWREDDTLWVEDLGSTNGTTVNGERVERARIAAGDKVLLGRAVVSIHELAQPAKGVEGPERLTARLEEEVTRARFFKHGLSALLLRAADARPLHQWCAEVQQQLRPVDRAGLYHQQVLAVVLPQASAEEATRTAEAIVARSGNIALRGGVASFPDTASSAAKLLEVARAALDRTDAEHPVRSAATLQDPRAWIQPEDDTAAPGAPVVHSPAMQRVYELVDRLARSTIPVLILGETGTGKELVARAIHERGPRKGKPMRSVNCAAIPDQLIESVLFGHEKGAFTGATQRARGVFEEADGGTVFLDEVGELSAPAQAALLRVLETRQICRVGSPREIAVDVRVVAATHCDLEAMCAVNTFRWDLLFRLNTMVLRVPPLRERPEEIEPLARHFLERAIQDDQRGGGSPARELSAEALALLRAHCWTGNVRELRNEIERAVVIADSETITPADLSERVQPQGDEAPALLAPAAAPEEGDGLDFKGKVQRYERGLIEQALQRTGWNQTAAARELQMPIRTLASKITAYGLKDGR